MKKISLFILSFLFISVFDLHSQVNSLKLLAQIDKYKIYATLVDGKQDGNSIQDTTTGLIQKTFFFLRNDDSTYSYIKANNLLYIIRGFKRSPHSSNPEIVPISNINNIINIDPDSIIRLPGNEWPDGYWMKDTWYCLKYYTYIDINHVNGLEKCYMTKADGIKLTKNYKVIYLIDYNNNTATEINRVKIE